MKKKLLAILTTLLFAATAITVHLYFRSDALQNAARAQAGAAHERITRRLAALPDSPRGSSLTTALSEIAAAEPTLIMIAAFDRDRTLITGVQKDRAGGETVYATVTDEYRSARQRFERLTDRYYAGGKYFAASARGTELTYVCLYPFAIARRTMVQLILEMVAIVFVIGAAVATMFFVLPKRRRESVMQDAPQGDQRTGRRTQEDARIASLMSDIIAAHRLESAAVYRLRESDGVLVLAYESSGGGFTRNERGDVVENRAVIINELAKGSPVLRNRSRELVMPLAENRRFIGALRVTARRALSGDTIAQLRKSSRELALALSGS